MILIQRKQKKAERKAAKLAAKRKAEEEAKKAEAMEETSDEQVWWSSMSVQDDCIDIITNPPAHTNPCFHYKSELSNRLKSLLKRL